MAWREPNVRGPVYTRVWRGGETHQLTTEIKHSKHNARALLLH